MSTGNRLRMSKLDDKDLVRAEIRAIDAEIRDAEETFVLETTQASQRKSILNKLVLLRLKRIECLNQPATEERALAWLHLHQGGESKKPVGPPRRDHEVDSLFIMSIEHDLEALRTLLKWSRDRWTYAVQSDTYYHAAMCYGRIGRVLFMWREGRRMDALDRKSVV